MRPRHLLTLLLCAAMAGTWARPDPAVTTLMQEPVTLWDMGIHRLKHRLDEVAVTREWAAGGSSLRIRARYDRSANQIRVISRLYSFTGNADEAKAKCKQLMTALRMSLGVYPPLGQPAAPTSDMVELFVRDGQVAGSGTDMDELGRVRDRITRIYVGIFRPEDRRAHTACEGPLLGTHIDFDK